MFARFTERLNDPDILSMTPDIALLDSRVGELLESTAVTSSTWSELRALFADLRKALKRGDDDAARETLTSLTSVINIGVAESARWRDIAVLIRDRRAMVETERKLSFDESKAIPREQVMVLTEALKRTVLDFIPEPERQKEFIAEYARVCTGSQ